MLISVALGLVFLICVTIYIASLLDLLDQSFCKNSSSSPYITLCYSLSTLGESKSASYLPHVVDEGSRDLATTLSIEHVTFFSETCSDS